MQECAEAVVQVLDEVGVSVPVVLVGTSWGGFVAPRVALLAPNRVRGIVVFNTSAERGRLFERTRATVLTKLLAVRALDQVTGPMVVSGLLAPETRRRQPELGPEIAETFLSWDRRGLIASVSSVLVDRDAVLDAVGRVTAPVLIVSGAEDHTLPSIHSRRIAEKLVGSHHVEVAGAAHLVPLEASDQANRLVLDFLQQLLT